MEENRTQVLDRLLSNLNDYDIFSSKYQNAEALARDVVSMLRPFLQNPDRHQEHVKVIAEYAIQEAAIQTLNPLMKLYNFLLLRRFPLEIRDRMVSKIRARVLSAKEDLLASVDPGKLDIDLLPLTSLPTKADWKKQKRRLVLIESRGVAQPAPGMHLRAISHMIEISVPQDSQFVDSSPSTEMELIGQREISISEKGKFVRSVSVDATVKSSLSGGPAKLESELSAKDSETIEREAGGSEKLSDSPHVARIISSAVGTTAMWRLLRTPTQNLLGSNKYSATVLVSAEVSEIKLSITHSADIDGWGLASKKEEYQVPIPQAEA